MPYFPRSITKRGTVRIFNDHWHAERFGSLIGAGQNGRGLQPRDLVFVYIGHWGEVPELLYTNNSPDAYGNQICRLERVD